MTYTVKTIDGYTIEFVNLNGTDVTSKLVDGKITLNKKDLKTINALSFGLVSTARAEAETIANVTNLDAEHFVVEVEDSKDDAPSKNWLLWIVVIVVIVGCVSFITIVVVIASILLIGVVLIQNSKGGGLASSFQSQNQIMGVKKTTETIEKATWILVSVVVVLSIASAAFYPRQQENYDSQLKDMYQNEAPASTTDGLQE